ncbi:helix-turn-helix transcriptional regulator [Actinoplanes flavus]|uniref:Helix-turn-helix transcriptional regulator n=1 Tax=Actinoplanes flavus TaxID=2820290 RepID=A0ABS3UCU2_9ACTN|nr:helix-turn-helix transcriptional regulator [Actinoplanes flavus]MBO3736609.1 helix-turn-helix transcriptional regulator [Actinoplanes flavus]
MTASAAESTEEIEHDGPAVDGRARRPVGGEPAMSLPGSQGSGPESELGFERRLRRARKWKRRWTQLQLAQRICQIAPAHGGTAEQHSLKTMISKWENGMKIPSQHNRHLLAVALGVTVEDLGLAHDPDFRCACFTE